VKDLLSSRSFADAHDDEESGLAALRLTEWLDDRFWRQAPLLRPVNAVIDRHAAAAGKTLVRTLVSAHSFPFAMVGLR
jgi:hypothetical protein